MKKKVALHNLGCKVNAYEVCQHVYKVQTTENEYAGIEL